MDCPCVFSHPTDTENWDKPASYFWIRSHKLLSIIITTISIIIIIIVLCCVVASSSSLWWQETACICFFLVCWLENIVIWFELLSSPLEDFDAVTGMEIESGTCLLLTLGWMAHTLGHWTPALSLNLGLVLLHVPPVLDKQSWAFVVD